MVLAVLLIGFPVAGSEIGCSEVLPDGGEICAVSEM